MIIHEIPVFKSLSPDGPGRAAQLSLGPPGSVSGPHGRGSARHPRAKRASRRAARHWLGGRRGHS